MTNPHIKYSLSNNSKIITNKSNNKAFINNNNTSKMKEWHQWSEQLKKNKISNIMIWGNTSSVMRLMIKKNWNNGKNLLKKLRIKLVIDNMDMRLDINILRNNSYNYCNNCSINTKIPFHQWSALNSPSRKNKHNNIDIN
jgi:hypothetical protein